MALFAAALAGAFLSAFAGTWTCTLHVPSARPSTSHWSIAAVPHSSWTVVHWAGSGTSGTAYVGYLAPEADWIYEDFHDDGSFASNRSAGPLNGIWTWEGSFTTPQRVLHGAIQWQRRGNELRRGFGRSIGTSFQESASDSCRKT